MEQVSEVMRWSQLALEHRTKDVSLLAMKYSRHLSVLRLERVVELMIEREEEQEIDSSRLHSLLQESLLPPWPHSKRRSML